jgi:hypothetical protein
MYLNNPNSVAKDLPSSGKTVNYIVEVALQDLEEKYQNINITVLKLQVGCWSKF